MRMRNILVILASITFLSTKAQTHLPVIPDSTNQQWQLSKYAGLSIGTTFFTGRSTLLPRGFAPFPGGTTFISAPIGLQLSHPLNRNLYAFAGVSAAPVFFSFNRLYTQPITNSSYPGYNGSRPYNLGVNGRVEMGLMYVNDDHTFSISGSIGVERG